MRKKKVLIIEDDAGIQELITYILETDGFEVESTVNNLTTDLTPFNADVILLDEWINKKEGHMLCKEIKMVHATQHIPVIILSTAVDIEEIARNCDADGFIAKPFDIEEVSKEVRRVLQMEESTKAPSFVIE
ncbi:MAG: cseB [Pedobacter sp.]|jgi:DNA-binding response OmpR family regulator|nr:cseB [Pedobacter sp.]